MIVQLVILNNYGSGKSNIRNSNNQEEIATNTVNLTKLIVDKLYEGI